MMGLAWSIVLPMMGSAFAPTPPKLEYSDAEKAFVVTIDNKPLKISTDKEIEVAEPFAAFRRNDRFVVWDDRGLVIRTGKKVANVKLGDLAVSAKANTREEILKTVDLIKAGKRSREPDTLAGALRVGLDVYLLPRWTDSDGQPWLEALYKVNLADENPRPKFIGRFSGFTKCYKPIGEELIVVNGNVSAITTQGDSWSLASYDPNKETFSASVLGSNLVSVHKGGVFVESTGYGTYMFGTIDLGTATRRARAEFKDPEFEVMPNNPDVVMTEPIGATELTNIKTGAVLRLKGIKKVKSAGRYMLVWPKLKDLTTAELYEPTRWTRVAIWKKPN